MKRKNVVFTTLTSFALAAAMLSSTVPVHADGALSQTAFMEQLKQSNYQFDEAVVVEVTSMLELNQKASISNVTFVDKGIQNAHVVWINGEVTLNNVTIQAEETSKSGLYVGAGADLSVNDLTISHNSAKGAPIIANRNAKADFNGKLDLTLSEGSWYGINVDSGAKVDLSDADLVVKTHDNNKTQSALCIDDSDANTVVMPKDSTLSTVATEDGQLAYVNADDLGDFIMAKKDKDVTEVVLNSDIALTSPLYLQEGMTIKGNGHAFKGSEALGKENVVTAMAKDEVVVLDDVQIVTTEFNKSGLHVYGGNVTANDLVIDNTKTAGGAAVVLNGGTLETSNATFLLGDNSWGAVNVDNRSGVEPKLTIADSVKVEAPEGKSTSLFYVDEDKADAIDLNDTVDIKADTTMTVNGDTFTLGEDGEIIPHIMITIAAVVDGKVVDLSDVVDPSELSVEALKGYVFSEADLEELSAIAKDLDFEGHVFQGFFLDQEGTKALKANEAINEDTTIYMIWNKKATITPVDPTTPQDKPQTPNTTPSAPNTGDTTTAGAYALLALLSLGLAGTIALKKKLN